MALRGLADTPKRQRSLDERLTARFPADVAEGIRRVAQVNERSVSAEIVRAVRDHIRREREHHL